jgi:hypothetical protein
MSELWWLHPATALGRLDRSINLAIGELPPPDSPPEKGGGGKRGEDEMHGRTIDMTRLRSQVLPLHPAAARQAAAEASG